METLQRTANRGSVSTGYDIDNSLKLEADNTESLTRSAQDGGNRKITTISFWTKRTELTSSYEMLLMAGVNSANYTSLGFGTGNEINFHYYNGGSYPYNFTTQRLFRDTSAWYHIVIGIDTTQATDTNRVKFYVNGEQIANSDLGTNVYPSQDIDTPFNNNSATYPMEIGNDSVFSIGGIAYSGYITEFNFIDGSQLTPTSFGEFDEDSGIWKPKAYTGSYGTNGFYLDFETAGSLGADSSGNSNNFSLVNITSADQATDTPTNNFCTLNPLSYNVPYTASQGNTKYVKNDTTYGMASGTHYVGAGKWYWEIKVTDFGTYSSCSFGIIDAYKPTVDANERGYEDPSLAATNPDILAMSGAPNNWFMNSNGTISNNGPTSSVDYTFYEGDILAFALDMDNGAYWMGNSRYSGVANGSFWIAPGGTTTSGSVATTDPTNGNYALVGDGGGTNSGTPNFNGGTITGGSLLTAGFTLVTPLLGAYHSNTEVTLEVNFGGFTSYGEDGGYSDANGYGNFAYAVPSGFYSLCSKNIAEFGGSG